VFYVHLQPLEGHVSLFDFSQIVLLLVFSPRFSGEVVLLQYSADSGDAAGELKLLDKALGAEAGETPGFQHLVFNGLRNFAWKAQRACGAALEAGKPIVLVSPEPLAHSVAGNGEGALSLPYAVL